MGSGSEVRVRFWIVGVASGIRGCSRQRLHHLDLRQPASGTRE
jgi:hypothetical protein